MGPPCSLIKWRYLHNTFKFSLFIWVFMFAANDVALGFSSDLDKSALLEFKASVSDTSGLLSSWNSSTDHCAWSGVACDAKSRVLALNITGGNFGGYSVCVKISRFPLYGFGIRRACLDVNGRIKGKLPSVIGKLSELKVLSLPFNELSGELPVEVWGMENLEVLDLEGNKVSGIMPSKFKGLRNLRVLNLGFNEIEGEIPDSLSDCGKMQMLNLAGNKVNGSIPGFVGEFEDLRGLYLSFNQLSGSIPMEIGDKCWKLEYLELSGNFLTEGIPKSLGNCKGLRSVQLFSNMLEGDIPADLGKLNQLEVLDVSRNSLNGAIPPDLGNCTKLSILVLSNSWDPLPVASSMEDGISSMKLAFTNDEYNFYDGSIPTEIPSLANLRMLWAPRATLEGELPTYWGVCNNLEIVNLGQNYLTGGVSERFSDCKRLKFLNLSSNNLTGELVSTLHVPCMTVFDISGNNLSGWIPEFNSNSCAQISSFKVLESYDPSSAYIYYFSRRTQALVNLPSFEDVDTHAVLHNFGDNSFTSPLPVMPIVPSMSTEKIVYAFLAGRNKLNVPFPENLFDRCNDVSSMLIDVSYNGLTGPLPSDIASRCQCLTYLDASNNQITGVIPSNFGDVNSPVVINLSSNHLQGLMPDSLSRHQNLKSLSLAGNNLTGTIPVSLGQLHSLEVLDLSSNSISGEIPKYLANLKKLVVLLLNNNKLSGPIPPDLANVTTITTFNVSFNNLSGPLPQNVNMMKCRSVLGNPLLRSCDLYSSTSPGSDQQGDKLQSPSSPSQSPEQDHSDFIDGFGWKPVLIGYCFGILFGLYIVCLMFFIGKPLSLMKFVQNQEYRLVMRKAIVRRN